MLKIYCKDRKCRPIRAHSTDAGLDLKADKTYQLSMGIVTKIHTGIHVEIPEGYVGLIFPRSGLATKFGISLANSVGVIDSDYRGEIICAIKYIPQKGFMSTCSIKQYERIAQLVIVPCKTDNISYVNSLEDLSNTDRGEGGFGHTGR